MKELWSLSCCSALGTKTKKKTKTKKDETAPVKMKSTRNQSLTWQTFCVFDSLASFKNKFLCFKKKRAQFKIAHAPAHHFPSVLTPGTFRPLPPESWCLPERCFHNPGASPLANWRLIVRQGVAVRRPCRGYPQWLAGDRAAAAAALFSPQRLFQALAGSAGRESSQTGLVQVEVAKPARGRCGQT